MSTTKMGTTLSPRASQDSPSELALPMSFESLKDIKEMPNPRLNQRPLVNVIGIITDYQPPIPTQGTDWKSRIEIRDFSTQFDHGIKVDLFYPRDKMPRISGAGDILLIRRIKVQFWNGAVSLVKNFATEFNVFSASNIPLWPLSSVSVLLSAMTTNNPPPSLVEANYVTWLHHHIDKVEIPNADKFEQKMSEALNLRDKYSLFKNLKAEHFYDLIGEVIRLYDSDGRITLYLSDYTPHRLFYNHVWGGGEDNKISRDGDEYGYTKSKTKKAAEWPGPFGKMTMQLTVYDPHAAYIREQVKVGQWIMLRNVKCGMGKMGDCLEAFLREDRYAHPGKIQVHILRQSDEADSNDVRWTDAVRRRLQWWTRHKDQKKEFLEGATEESPGKRKRDDGEEISKKNGKKRREEKRAIIEQKLAEKLNINENVKCRNPNTPPTLLFDILSRRSNLIKSSEGSDKISPFVNLNYRANVRVIDFWPHKLEEFVVERRVSEYDMLSDYSGGESTDHEGDMEQFRNGKGFGGEKTPEWRFALRVEEISNKDKDKAEKMWLIVDHESAQGLLDLDPSTNLRQNEDLLIRLRETLFKLWGDLEEKKTTFLKTNAGKALLWASKTPVRAAFPPRSSSSSPEPEIKSLRPFPRRGVDDPPPDSDDENDCQPVETNQESKDTTTKSSILTETSGNNGLIVTCKGKIESKHLSMSEAKKELEKAIESLPVNNKGFNCCVKQYGIKVPEANEKLADAGEGLRWKRMFGLFGTYIS